MNKCAKFHEDSPSGKKVKFNLVSAIELSETADFVYNFVKKASNFSCAFDKLFLWIFMQFLQKIYFVYTMVQKSQKWPKTQIKGVLP